MNANNETVQMKKDDARSTRLKQCVVDELESYFATLDGQEPHDVYKLVMGEVEEVLVRYIMEHYNENQCRVADVLGINRGTLRKRLKDYNI